MVFPSVSLAEETRLLGDADGNGRVNAADAALVLRYLVQLTPLVGANWYAADANGDGKVDSADAAFILRALVELAHLDGEITVPPMISNLRWAAPLNKTTLEVGEQLTLTVAYDLDGAAPPKLEFVCSNPAILSLTQTGDSCVLTALWAGFATVKVLDPLSRWEIFFTLTLTDKRAHPLYYKIYSNLRIVDPDFWTNPVFDYVMSLDPNNGCHRVMLTGMELLGKTYSEYDCSKFTMTAFKDAGFPNVKTGASRDQLNYYKNAGLANPLSPNPFTGQFDLSMVPPGSLLFWVDKNGVSNHIGFYLGRINGMDFLLESASGAGGVVIRPNWGSSGSYTLAYWVAPLG